MTEADLRIYWSSSPVIHSFQYCTSSADGLTRIALSMSHPPGPLLSTPLCFFPHEWDASILTVSHINFPCRLCLSPSGLENSLSSAQQEGDYFCYTNIEQRWFICEEKKAPNNFVYCTIVPGSPWRDPGWPKGIKNRLALPYGRKGHSIPACKRRSGVWDAAVAPHQASPSLLLFE